jgi:DNA gyrase subunit A
MGRATQGVRLINLEKRNDEIASVCKVNSNDDAENNSFLIDEIADKTIENEEFINLDNDDENDQ